MQGDENAKEPHYTFSMEISFFGRAPKTAPGAIFAGAELKG